MRAEFISSMWELLIDKKVWYIYIIFESQKLSSLQNNGKQENYIYQMYLELSMS